MGFTWQTIWLILAVLCSRWVTTMFILTNLASFWIPLFLLLCPQEVRDLWKLWTYGRIFLLKTFLFAFMSSRSKELMEVMVWNLVENIAFCVYVLKKLGTYGSYGMKFCWKVFMSSRSKGTYGSYGRTFCWKHCFLRLCSQELRDVKLEILFENLSFYFFVLNNFGMELKVGKPSWMIFPPMVSISLILQVNVIFICPLISNTSNLSHEMLFFTWFFS